MSCTRYVNPGLKRRLLAGDLPAWLAQHPRRDYIIQATLSAPPWVDRKALYVLRDRARELTRLTGIEHVLDHIVPLKHPRVSGLTVPWNLQVVPRSVNGAKGNAWCEWHGELFPEAA